jgi:hypothetical protein
VVEAKEEDNAVVDPVAPVVHQIPKFPDPYIRGAAGGVYVRTTDEEGDLVDELVYVNDLYFTRRVHDAVDGESIVGRLHLPHDGVREVVVPLVSATSKEDLRKALAKSGVSTFGKGWDKIMAYTHSWLTHLQATTVSDESRRQFGWTDHKLDCFVIGDKEITADGIGYNPPSPATAAYFHALEQMDDTVVIDRPEKLVPLRTRHDRAQHLGGEIVDHIFRTDVEVCHGAGIGNVEMLEARAVVDLRCGPTYVRDDDFLTTSCEVASQYPSNEAVTSNDDMAHGALLC